VERARVLLAKEGISARDAVHLAVMRAHRIRRVISFDRGFDRIEGIERLPPIAS
jgi:predicted nucleic acid-binding protein